MLRDLYKVLKSLPQGTKKIDIEYVDSEEETKIVIYPSDGGPNNTDNKTGSSPDISIDDDLIDLL